jgi:hypothetical protein
VTKEGVSVNAKRMDSLTSNALGSAFANFVSRTCTHPLDLAKARLQAVYASTDGSINTRSRYRGTLDVLTRTVRTEGIFGLYRGFGAVVVGGTPGSILYFCSYEIAKASMSESFESSGKKAEFLVHFLSGMLAEAVACLVYVPVDVTKERMQVQLKNEDAKRSTGFYYRNSWDALKQICRTEGLSGIYKGYGATLGSFGPFSALYFVFYERFKYWARLHSTTGPTTQSMRDLEQVKLSFPRIILCSSTAAGISAWITSPLDLAKLRLQIQRGHVLGSNSHSHAQQTMYKGVSDCLKKVFEAGGLAGLFRGAGARVLFTVPATTISMTSYETSRLYFAKGLDSRY